jgi:hypothetical protein
MAVRGARGLAAHHPRTLDSAFAFARGRTGESRGIQLSGDVNQRELCRAMHAPPC